MRIGIDARFYGVGGKGIGRYLQKLIENLEKIDLENQYFIFLKKKNFNSYQPKNKNFHKILADYPWYSFKEQIFLPLKLKKYHLDLVHFPHFNVPILYFGNFVVTIHDLTHHFFNKKTSKHNFIFYFLKYLAYKLAFFLAVKKAKKIITVSNFVKNQLIKYFRIKGEKIAVIYEGVDFKNIESEKPGFQIKSPYLLYVGNAYPHKNLENLIKAFSELKDLNLSMVLVGKIDYFYERLKKIIKKFSLEKKIILTDEIPDRNLKWLYKNALAYVFPSLSEGFGLPGLEAMTCGIPVIASDKTSLPEIYGPAAIYFSPENIEEIVKAIKKILKDKNLREKLIKKGFEQIKKYSWEDCARRTIEIYLSE